MENRAVEIELLQYNVEEFSFKLRVNNEAEFKEDTEINLQPILGRGIARNGDDYKITLSLEMKNQRAPFDIGAVVSGVFRIKGDSESSVLEVAENNATAIIFPYLRALVTGITSNAGLPPFILPVCNIGSYFDSVKEQSKAEKIKR